MELIDSLRLKCQEILKYNNDEKYRYIEKILEDDNCFFIIDMDVALDILNSLGVNNPLEYYKELVGYSNVSKHNVKIID